MTKKKIVIILFMMLICVAIFFVNNYKKAKADELTENIEEELEKIDFGDLSDFTDNNLNPEIDFNAVEYIKSLLSGEYDFDFGSITSYIKSVLFGKISEILPIFLSLMALSIFAGLLGGLKGNFTAEGVSEVISIACGCAIILLTSSLVISVYQEVKIVIENISKLVEIVSPIILTLMIGSGGVVSAQVYQPVVLFLSNGITQVFSYLIIPLIGIMFIFNVLSAFSSNLNIKKYSSFLCSLFKWIIGITVTVFGVFLSVQGISAATYDGISIKAAKYTISNSIPLIGGFLKEGFDLVLAGSILIKNAVGLSSVFILFYLIVSPILFVAATSLLFKLTGAVIEPLTDGSISDFCISISKSLSYLAIALLMVSFMFFITVLLLIFSASSFI